MKKSSFIVCHLSLSVALVVSVALVALTACSSSEDSIAEAPTPSTPDAPKTYTMTVTASKADNATTRALTWGDADPVTGKQPLNATWAEGETVDVYQWKKKLKPGSMVDYHEYQEKVGTLTARANGATATLSGTVTMSEKTNLNLYYGSPSYDYRGQVGTIADISSNFDYASAILTKNKYNLENGKMTLVNPETPLNFANKQAIVKFILKDTDDNDLSVRSLTVGATDDYRYILAYSIPTESAEEVYTSGTSFTVTSSADTNKFYVAMPEITSFPIRLEASNSNLNLNYYYEKSGVSFTKGKYYEVTVKMKRQAKTVDLSKLTDNFTLVNGDVLTGTLDGSTQKVKVTIEDGATVTLRGATINGVHYGGSNDTECLWAGITCLGDATIVLADGTTNTVKNFNRKYPCIQAAVGKTLIITGGPAGTGKLIANNSNFGAGIGGGDGIDCGNIEIQGGDITATGGDGAAGIGGGGIATCGPITISGGTVTATGGGGAAGIGSGNSHTFTSSCGAITITGGKVTATGGDGGAGIGTGSSIPNSTNTCGAITISGGNVSAQGIYSATGIGCGNAASGGSNVCGEIRISKGTGFVSVVAIRSDNTGSMPIGVSSGVSEDCRCGQIYFDGVPIIQHFEWTPNAYDPKAGTYGNLNFTITTQRLGDKDQEEGSEHVYDNNKWTLTP